MADAEGDDAVAVWLDKLAIREVLERFMRCDDDRAINELVDLFDEDAVVAAGDGEHVGRDAIKALMSGGAASQPVDPPPWTAPGEQHRQPRTMHLCVNPLIEVDGDTATAESDFVVLRADGAGRPSPMFAGRFRDRLRRHENGHWLITNRTGVTLSPKSKT